MGNLVADAMLDRVRDQGIDIAIQNGGGLRATIDSGDITMGEVLTVLPFQNTLATFQLTGAGIVEALENGVSQVEDGAGRFPQVSGMRYVWNPEAEPGSRIVSVEVETADGFAPLDPEATYGVVSNNYMRGGGDGYATFTQGMNAYDFGPGLEQVVADYIMAAGGYTPYTDGRISTAD
jgi:5'-nucleotidase